MAAALNVLERHLVLVGFMGAGKSTLGPVVAERLGRPFVDVDARIEEVTGTGIVDLFANEGEDRFRRIEEEITLQTLQAREPAVATLGGGAVSSPETRAALRRQGFTVLLDVGLDEAWERTRGSDRPLAQDREVFESLYELRRQLYDEVADARATEVDGIVLAAGGVHVQLGSLELLGQLVPGEGPVELVADAHVAGIYGVQAQLALGARGISLHEVPAGEAAKTGAHLERLWHSLAIGRDGTLIALGGGCTTDLAGFAAATYMRGVAWVPVPTTLVGQVDAAIGGKTAIDLPAGKNLVGAFHWPVRTVIDPALLETLPDVEMANGRAEAVKTGLLAGEALWELPLHEQVRRCAAFKVGICLRDPYERGPRAQLNLGHTFAHALEAAAAYELPHGRAVALGLLAALRLSGNSEGVETVERVLSPEPVSVDRDAAWKALGRDKKATAGRPRLVLLERPGVARWGVEVPDREVRSALDALISG